MIRALIFATCVVVPVLSYSTGAPDVICRNNLVPEHHVEPQGSPSPYRFLGSDAVRSGDKITLKLEGPGFLGFAVQARDASGQPIGQFKIIESNKSQTLGCVSNGDTLTHKKIPADNPLNQVEFEWIAPSNYNGRVQIVGTVARDGGTYWVRKTLKDIVVQ